jgi:predicted choloylglycine hydrolase
MLKTVPCLNLRGSAFERGLQQARDKPEMVASVQQAIKSRLITLNAHLKRLDINHFLMEQMDYLQSEDPEGFDESLGLAKGYGFTHTELIAYLHGNVISDMALANRGPELDGCTTWAQSRGVTGRGALVVKNRDYRGEHGALQHIFFHRDPSWNGRALLCLGSLGSPGAFSSGMNSDGLVVVDNQIATSDHGPGWLRYFLMTALLRTCATVEEALEFILGVTHSGGGSLVLGDRLGQVAAVELGHRNAPAVFRDSLHVSHTNHFENPDHQKCFLANQDDVSDSSLIRLITVQEELLKSTTALNVAQAQTLMSSHRSIGAVCRHGGESASGTLSSVIYDTGQLSLTVSHGPPCLGLWSHWSLSHGDQ